MDYSIEKSIEFARIIKLNGYIETKELLFFEKQVSKNNNGLDESFEIILNRQLSGYVGVDLYYTKKLEHSPDTLKVSQFLCCKIETLDERIKFCEQKCISIKF